VVAAGLPPGPLLVLVGYVLMLKFGAVSTDIMLFGLLVWPTALLPAIAAIAAASHRDASRWIDMTLGAFIGTGGAAAVLVSGISAIAGLISDPGAA
jgi:hypothetical protein